MKQSEKKQGPKKKTLSEVCQERIHTTHSIQREREQKVLDAKHREQEDAMMALIYGPNWRQKQLPGDLPPPAKYAQVDDNPYDYLPESATSEVRLKAS